jgi:hypothetical protein
MAIDQIESMKYICEEFFLRHKQPSFRSIT